MGFLLYCVAVLFCMLYQFEQAFFRQSNLMAYNFQNQTSVWPNDVLDFDNIFLRKCVRNVITSPYR